MSASISENATKQLKTQNAVIHVYKSWAIIQKKEKMLAKAEKHWMLLQAEQYAKCWRQNPSKSWITLNVIINWAVCKIVKWNY